MIKKDGSPGLIYPIQVTFLILRLTNLIDWNWWIVFLPSMLWLAFMFIYLFLKEISREI